MSDFDVENTYKRRFGADVEFRNKMYRVLCKEFFQKYIPQDAVVLEIAAGYCEFINNIDAKRKIAVDLNPDVKKFAENNVEAIVSSSASMSQVKDNSCDVVYTSNFLEHLAKQDIIKTIREALRILKPGGKFLILQPNIRFCYKDYWNFFDHITPLDDKSISEILETNGFKVTESLPKFLPYSTKSRFPQAVFLIKIYLKIPILRYFFGKQAFICAQKTVHTYMKQINKVKI